MNVQRRQLVKTSQGPAERAEAHRQQQPVGVGNAPATVGQVLARLLQVACGYSRQDDAGLAEGRVLIAQLLDRLRPARHGRHLVEQPVTSARQRARDAVSLCHQAPQVLFREPVARAVEDRLRVGARGEQPRATAPPSSRLLPTRAGPAGHTAPARGCPRAARAHSPTAACPRPAGPGSSASQPARARQGLRSASRRRAESRSCIYVSEKLCFSVEIMQERYRFLESKPSKVSRALVLSPTHLAAIPFGSLRSHHVSGPPLRMISPACSKPLRS